MRTYQVGLSALGVGLGAGIVYLLDRTTGSSRRALLRDKTIHVARITATGMDKTVRDIRNRTYGLIAAARRRWTSGPVSDEMLVARIRSRLGREISHPSSILVYVKDGKVTLRGPIFRNEAKRLVRFVSKCRGVREIEDRLDVYDAAGGLSGLWSRSGRTGSRLSIFRSNWPPATRLVAVLTGGLLATLGIRQGGAIGAAAGGLGIGLATRGLTNRPMRHLLGKERRRAAGNSAARWRRTA